MTTAAGAVVAMNGSAHAASDADVGYDVNASSTNLENPAPRKQNSLSNPQRQRSASNLRSPLSTIPPTPKATNNFSRITQNHVSDPSQMQADGSGRTGTHNGSKPNGNLSKKESYDDIPENMYRPEKGEYEGWIHREKLAKIESEELQAAGINLAKARSRSRDALGDRIRESSMDRLGSGSTANRREDKRQRLSPPVPTEEEERSNWDFRTPEEIAADQAAGQIYASPVLRKSGSKIPVLTSSPTPIPSERYERETPMPRKRTLSGSLTPEDNLSVAKTRSGGADGEVATAGSQSGSPTKSRSKSTTVSRPGTSSGLINTPGNRKVSAPAKAPSANNGRPSTRGNDMERPRTAVNKPEGDPPWLATMYKPDPSLPPDQQVIPTLAKKQMQEQWALNGQVPKVYDREFNSLAVHDNDQNKYVSSTEQAEPQPVQKTEEPDLQPLKPLPSTKSSSSQVKSPMIGSSGATGGYSTMPKVASPAIGLAPSPNIGSASNERASKSSSFAYAQGRTTNLTPGVASPPASRVQSHRMPRPTDEQDEKAQKKGCCCIVM